MYSNASAITVYENYHSRKELNATYRRYSDAAHICQFSSIREEWAHDIDSECDYLAIDAAGI